MRRIGFLVSILFLLMSAAALPAAAEIRVALVVGNANYRNVPSLTNPADDARLMAIYPSRTALSPVRKGADGFLQTDM